MGYIYKISNSINDKVYIGQTIQLISERWKVHLFRAKNGHKTHLYSAMRKYGIENFTIEELEQVDNKELDDRERYWIKYYNSYYNGYNSTLGGQDSKSLYPVKAIKEMILAGASNQEIIDQYHCNKKTIYNICKREFGTNFKTIHSEIICNKIIEYYQTKRSISATLKYFNISYDTFNRICKKQNVQTEQGKSGILVYFLDENNTKQYFKSIAEASKATELNRKTIERSLNNNNCIVQSTKTGKKYRWFKE